MTSRLLGEIHTESERLLSRSAGYKHAGERELAGLANAAAVRLSLAVEAIVALEHAERDAKARAA